LRGYMPKVIFLDTETTSVDTERCGMYQVSGIIDIDGKTVEEFNVFSDIFSDDLVEESAFAKNGYTLAKIHQLPYPLKAFSAFCNMLRKHVDQYDKLDKFIVVGYMADFDNRVLRQWFLKNGSKFFGAYFWVPWIDVMQLAMYILQDKRHEMENFKLITVAKFVGLPADENQNHDALYDAKMTRDLYYELAK